MGSACSANSSIAIASKTQRDNSHPVSSTSVKQGDDKPDRNGTDLFNGKLDSRGAETDSQKAVQTTVKRNKLAERQTTKEMEESSEVIENKEEVKEDDNDNEKDSEKDENEDENDDEKKKKKEPMTEEELEEFKQKKYADLRNTAAEVFALQTYQNEAGEYDKLIRNACVRFSNSYHALKRTRLEEIVKYRIECAKIMIDSKIIDIFCDIVTYTYTNGWSNEDGKKNELKYAPFSKCLAFSFNFSDCSDELTVYLTNKQGFLELFAKILIDYQDRHLGKIEPALKPSEDKVLYSVLSIIHNLAMRETNIGRLRSQDFTHILQPYLESPKAMHRLMVLASLAGIVNEEESEIINANRSIVAFLMKVLGNGLKDKRRRHRGWSCKESGLTVRTLARNDANKKLLVELGALELLVELGQTGNTAEQYESVAAIWALCFDKDNRTLVTSKSELGVVELLLELSQSEDPDIKKACMGALWTLRDDLTNSPVEKYMKKGKELSQKYERHKSARAQREKEPTSNKQTAGHVMISYQWANQETLKTIRDRIKAHGYKVWMDIDQMGGSTLQAMADAVEGANVILMCMSNKYKSSPACRAEAEYAFQTRKKIIPLKMEAGYNADGWLGFILGAKLFFDFSGKYPFEDKMNGLLKELDSTDGNVEHQTKSSVTAPTTGSQSTQAITTSSTTVAQPAQRTLGTRGTVLDVRKWSSENVRNWIERNDLKGCGLESMTGSEIAYLAKMQADAPEFFHKFLHDTVKAKTVSAIAKIGWALHDLSAGH